LGWIRRDSQEGEERPSLGSWEKEGKGKKTLAKIKIPGKRGEYGGGGGGDSRGKVLSRRKGRKRKAN